MAKVANKQLLNKVSRLEFEHDQLLAELSDVDELLRAVGFPEGLKSAKEVAQEVIRDGVISELDRED